MTYSLDSIFLDAPLTSPVAKIFIKTSTSHQYNGLNKLDFITPECVTQQELDYQIDGLHSELEDIRKAGQDKFAKWRPRSN